MSGGPDEVLEISDKEQALLVAMYGKMWDNINRHVVIVWQSITAILGSLALLGWVEKGVIGLDVGTAFVVIFSAWVIAHTYDASAWFNRNQMIVGKIEQLILREDVRKELHSVIGTTRDPRSMILQFQIQYMLALTIGLLALGYHFSRRVQITWKLADIDLAGTMPYIAALAAVVLVFLARQRAIAGDKSSGGRNV
jgi:hypothetical protein